MKVLKLLLILSCLITALTCSAAKYQIKVLNTPTITIDYRAAKVGDWFNDQSVIIWSRDNQAMRVVSDENKVYTLSAKLYKEAKAKKFSDFILYTKPLAARGTTDLDLIEQLAERFDQDFIMLDEIVVDLSGIDFNNDDCFEFVCKNNYGHDISTLKKFPTNQSLKIVRTDLLNENYDGECLLTFIVTFCPLLTLPSVVTDTLEIEVLPISEE